MYLQLHPASSWHLFPALLLLYIQPSSYHTSAMVISFSWTQPKYDSIINQNTIKHKNSDDENLKHFKNLLQQFCSLTNTLNIFFLFNIKGLELIQSVPISFNSLKQIKEKSLSKTIKLHKIIQLFQNSKLRTLHIQLSSVYCFFQQEHSVGLEVEDHQQPFQFLPEVSLEITLQTHRPCLVVRTKYPSPQRVHTQPIAK